MDWNLNIAFLLVVAVSFVVEGLVGFGGNLLALPLANTFLSMKTAVPALTIVSLIIAIIRVCQNRAFISKKDYLKIMAGMLVGLPVGMLLLGFLPERLLKMFLGFFMIVISLKELYKLVVKKDAANEKPPKEWLLMLALFMGGVLQGAFASGGPFVVIYATQMIKVKEFFSTTLFAVWLTTNSLITIKDCVVGNLTPQVLMLVLFSLPAIALALWVSDVISKRLNGERFSVVVYGILLLAGVLMFR